MPGGPLCWLFLAIVALMGPSGARASSAADTARGFVTRQAYDDGFTESVNLYNFNVVMTLPLSPTYPVADRLSYGLTAYYNAGIRWGISADGLHSSFGRSLGDPDMNGWLGMGWRLDFGKVINFITTDSTGQCVFVASNYDDPGGSFHVFNTSDMGHTIDGSGTQIIATAGLGTFNCRIPTRLQNNAGHWLKNVDPNTGQVTRFEDFTSLNRVDVSYMNANDFRLLDPNATPSTYSYNSPWPEIKEQTLAIKNITDTRGRTITTTMTPREWLGFRKFLLTDIAAPVFGDAPGSPTGHWTLHYEIRNSFSPPNLNWPPLDPNTPAGPFPLLTQVELPTDASGNRLTYTFDYNVSGELSEIRTPSGGRTVYAWGDEYISSDPDADTPGTRPHRVIVAKKVYPSFYDSPGTVYTWTYKHNRLPKQCDSTHDVYDKWRAIVTDPEGNDTEYRFFTTKLFSFAERPNWYPRTGFPGAVKVYKGQARRWLDGAMLPSERDPNYPGNGVLLRGTYYRYLYENPTAQDFIHLLGSQTIYFDDRLNPAFLPLDPNATDPACLANLEMDSPIASANLEGWAWHAQTHDPNNWALYPSIGTVEYKTTEKGNLVGRKEIEILGEGLDLCPVRPILPWSLRSLSEGGVLKELSQTDAGVCIRRTDLSRSYGFADRGVLYSRDIGLTTTWTSGSLSTISHSGGDPISPDPNATGNSGITYTETLGHTAGVISSRKFSGVSWFSEDHTIDPASGLPATSRDPAGIATSYDYDALGRTVYVIPGSPELPTVVSYPVETRTFTDTGLQTNSHRFSRSVEVSRGDFSGTPSGLYTKYEYDGLGRLTQELRGHADGSLIEQTHAYDGLNAPTFTSEWHPAGVTTAPGTTVSYRDGDPGFPPSGRREPFSRPLRITDPAGAAHTFSYFGLNERLTVSNINGVPSQTATTTTYRDIRGNVKIVQAPAGAHALYDYDYAGRLTRIRLVPSFTQAVYDDLDPNKPDLRADRFAHVLPTGAFVQTRSFLRDTLGVLRQTVEPEKGTSWHRAYDPMGNPTVTQDNGGRVTRQSYDPAGRLTKTEVAASTTGTYRAREILTYANDPASVGTHGSALSRLIRVESLIGTSTSPHVEREFTYNGLNGRLSKEMDRQAGLWSASPVWLSSMYTFDDFGLPTQLTYPTPDGSARTPMTVAYRYAHGFLTEVGSNKATSDPNAFTPLVSVTYGASGVPASLVFPNGVTEAISVDAASRPSSIRVNGPAGSYWISGAYSFDGAGNIARIGAQHYTYDKIGRLVSSTTSSMSDIPTSFSQSYAYDSYGSMTQRNGATGDQTFVVDPNSNRLTAINPSGANLQLSYDAGGSVTTDGVYDYVYDDRERLNQVKLKASSVLLENYFYDDRGWRSRKVDSPDARTIAYFRGLDGLVLSEYATPTGSGDEPLWTKDYVYALGRHIAAFENTEPEVPAGVTSSGSRPGESPFVALSWLPVSAPDILGYHVRRSSTGPSGAYVLLSNLPTAATSFTDTNVVAGTPYYYKLTSVDTAANESRETAPRKITPGDAMLPPAPFNFIGVAGPQPALTWQEPSSADGDLAGYRLFRGFPEETLSTLADSLPVGSTSYTDTTADPNLTYVYEIRSYDTAGNESSPSPSAAWPPMPGEGTGGGGNCGDHCMPGTGSLLLPRCGSSKAGGSLSGPEERFCLPGEAAQELAVPTSVEGDYRIVFYHVDHLGTPRVLTDEMGQVISKHALFPFGEEVPGPPSWSLADSTNTHWFTGHERDLGVGADYMMARTYSSLSGRFLAPDPLSLSFRSGGDSSYYAYVGNTPVLALDPTGEERTSTYVDCTVSAGAIAGSVLLGTFSAVAAVAPEPLFTKVGAVGLASGSVSLAKSAWSWGADCKRKVAEDEIIRDCIESGTRQTCEDAVKICENYRLKGDSEPNGCREARKRLKEFEDKKPENQSGICPLYSLPGLFSGLTSCTRRQSLVD